MKKRLIAYFSRADENYCRGEIKELKVGNTEIAAKKLQEITEADLLPLIMKEPYSKDYHQCVEEARKDLASKARPELVGLPEDLKDYTIVYLGFPNYCGTAPMPVMTFLEKYDFTGKKIRIFCTHEGSGLGRAESDVWSACPSAILDVSVAIEGSNVENCGELLEQWVRSFYGGQL